MRPDRPVRALLPGVLLSIVALSGCGGGDRVSGGTNGTEAGNAVSARIVRSDGSPAAGATGIFRPSEAIDSSTSSGWVAAAAGSDGVIHADLSDGSWTLEVHAGSWAVRKDFAAAPSLEFVDTLEPSRDLSGHLEGVAEGAILYLPGLARSTPVGRNGSFLFLSVPAGPTPLLSGGSTWALSDTDTTGLILSTRWGALPPGAGLAWIPAISDSNLAGPGQGIAPDPSSYLLDDPTEGKVRGAPLGALVGTIDSNLLPDTGAFAFAVRARTTASGVSSLWLLDWADSTGGGGFGLGIGGGRLVLRAGPVDTMVDVASDENWHWFALSANDRKLSVFLDGVPVLSMDAPSLGSRTAWTRREMGRGGAVQIAAFHAWSRDAAVQTVGR